MCAGDYAVKSVGVIPAPEITKYDFQPDDAFVIMASDGVWEFVSSQVWWSAPCSVDDMYNVTWGCGVYISTGSGGHRARQHQQRCALRVSGADPDCCSAVARRGGGLSG